ncbi:M23 family metallopeptidase [Planctomyces sp. SH-PL14]|uniref:M23 family metallopeptidase n=1 Tax=Planctomyces sp. SH-PL14 TaxID=1632864 RepID=UPI00078B35CF|nr:M23 family metallopeptidase [Planctomyces sp. SH-PL14]AMV20743.1 Murein DD-endopeptidase MepM [Planctomyces sp. SH-PL14]
MNSPQGDAATRSAPAVTRCLSLAMRRHDDSYRYALPYRFGERYEVSQGYHGAKSHTVESRYSIDFAMPERTVICAARDGKVIEVIDHYDRGGWYTSLKSQCNFVEIAHADGTVAVYAHLVCQGSRVAEGDVVHRGQPIALSGNTGWSDRPHLHFHVLGPDGVQLPTVFSTRDAARETLVEGEVYAHPGDESWLEWCWCRLCGLVVG